MGKINLGDLVFTVEDFVGCKVFSMNHVGTQNAWVLDKYAVEELIERANSILAEKLGKCLLWHLTFDPADHKICQASSSLSFVGETHTARLVCVEALGAT